MYLELTEQDTLAILRQLLLAAIPKFEFPRQSLEYAYIIQRRKTEQEDYVFVEQYWGFLNSLTLEEINILSTYMIVEWLGQQLASIENVRMKYSGSDFKFTSQANHMQKILQMKKDYQREGFHLQRLYKRRMQGHDGRIMSNWSILNQSAVPQQMEDITTKGKSPTIIYVDNRENDDSVVANWEPIGDRE